MKAQIYNISYDLDDLTDEEREETLTTLPTELIYEGLDADMSEEDMEEAMSDFISNKTGFCHKGYNYVFLDSNEEIAEQWCKDNGYDFIGIDNVLKDNRMDIQAHRGKTDENGKLIIEKLTIDYTKYID